MPPGIAGYRTLGQIGVGARSTINQVVRVTTGQFFALKRVVRRSADDDRFLAQVEAEYEVSSRADHPVLRKSYELQRVRKLLRTRELLLLMEYVSGKTLEQARPTDLGQTITVFKRVAEGLDALHETGYLHADIKPNNIIITEKGDVKIIDFGQSCRIGHKKDRIQGTPDYIAPEQVRRLPLDQRTDVFNVGATFYWVLTGQTFPTDIRPDARPGGHAIAAPKRAPKDVVPAIPAALSQLVMDCCASTPDKRPQDMKRLLARLDVAEKMWRKASAPSRADGAEVKPSGGAAVEGSS